MKLHSTRVALAACLLTRAYAVTTITYEDVSLGTQGYVNNTPYAASGVTHTNSFNSTWGSWSGFAISNNTNTTPSSYVPNEYISHAGGAASGSQFAVGYASSSMSTRLLFGGVTDMTGLSAQFTNTRAAANSMINGDSFAKKFGGVSGNDADFFLLSINGFQGGSAMGSTSLYLADFRCTDNSLDYILNAWTTIDFTPLGSVDEIRFTMSSSDVGSFGINTPTYFAMDQLVVPEPTSASLVMASALLLWRRRRAVTQNI
jgi:Domain of unknown function (DUF4465)